MATVLYKLGDDISTDVIYPGRYMATVLPAETPKFAFGDLKELNAALISGKVAPGSIILAGSNFGCGSSREQAASCLQGHALVIVAKSIARIFLQNAVNVGLEVVIVPDIVAEIGDELEFFVTKVINKTRGHEFAVLPHAQTRQAIIKAGGLVSYTRQRLMHMTASAS
ncbi:MAG TPA: 3-isopropylmalate dehydratase [Lacipirellulaceae bacterium]|nr:3-isopropylmalate dehydratase [Lacipirellulaceae bacterium]